VFLIKILLQNECLLNSASSRSIRVLLVNELPRSKLRGIYLLNMIIKQLKLISINLLILPTLAFDIVGYHFFITISSNCVDIVAARPKVTAPQQFLHLRMLLENLSPCNTFYRLHNVFWTHHWYTLYQKMHMVFINSNLYKMYFIPFIYPNTYVFQCFSNVFCKNLSPVFYRADDVIEKETLIMSFVDMFTHTPLYPEAELRGIL